MSKGTVASYNEMNQALSNCLHIQDHSTMANLSGPKFAVFFVKKSHCQTKNVEKTKNQMF